MADKLLNFRDYLKAFGKPVSGDPGYEDIQPGESISVLDYFQPEKLKRKQQLISGAEDYTDAYADYVKKANKMLLEAPQAPTLGQFGSSQGGLPTGFLEQNQVLQSPNMTPFPTTPQGMQDYQEAPVTPPISARYAQEIGAINPQSRLSPAQMTVASPLLEQKAVLGQGGEIVPTSLAGVENRKVLPQEIASALDVAGGGAASVPLPPTIASKAIEERTKYSQPMTYKDIPNKDVSLYLMGRNLPPTPSNIKMADEAVKAETEAATMRLEKEKNRLRAGTEGLDDASVALFGVPNSDVTGKVAGVNPVVTPEDVPRLNQQLQKMWGVMGIASKPPVVTPGMSKAALNLAVRDRVKLESAAAQGAAGEFAKPVEVSQQERVSVLENNLRILQGLNTAWTNLTPEQQQKYVGIINFPLSKLKQFLDQQLKGGSDPAFAQFATQIYLAKQLAFQSGGKQLTPFEASVVFGYTPTGEEMSVNDFTAKMAEAGVNTEDLLKRTAEVATVPRRELKGQVQRTIEQYRPAKKVTEAEYQKLPSGALYIAPNGKTMRKP